jgi:hypothetical protein
LNGLDGVLARAPDDVWAVGVSGAPYHADRTLIEHWDGSNWSVVPSPNADKYSDLYGVFGARSGGRLWAVGTSSPTLGGPIAPLVEEWDGSTWTITPTPPARSEAYLNGGTASADDDAWVVGQRYGGSGENRTLTEHWDGTRWTIVPSANRGRDTICDLGASAAVSTADVWAVGGAGGGPLLEHWDGSSWSLVRSPDPAYTPEGVAIRWGDSVWTAGSSFTKEVPQASTERWDGSAWSVVRSPSPGDSAYFTGIAAVPGSRDLWAVGVSTTSGVTATLIELYS